VDGDYLLTCTAAAANAGTFSVQTPDGREIGPLTVGVAFNKEIKLTIADGATDFVVGDSFKVRVGIEVPGDLTYGALNLTGTDGSQNAPASRFTPRSTDGSTTPRLRRSPGRRSQRQLPDLAGRHHRRAEGRSHRTAAQAKGIKVR
jgi:hypothetical protein